MDGPSQNELAVQCLLWTGALTAALHALTLADPGDDPATEVSIAAMTNTFPGGTHVVVLLPIGLVIDACYPMWIALAAANRGWPPSFRRCLVAVEHWVVALIAYALFLTDERPAFGLAAHGYELSRGRAPVAS